MLIEDLKNKAIMLWGFGSEGQDVLRFLKKRGLDNKACIYNDKETNIPEEFKSYPAYSGDALENLLTNTDVIIKSPGVSKYKDEIISAQKQGVKVTSSTDLVLSEIRHKYPKRKIIAVSGSKGKSTSVSALYHIMTKQGYKVALGGNIGRPLIDLIDDEFDYLIAEISSYQASDLSVSPHIAMFTNLYYVHSVWHLSHENYCRDKLHLIAHQEQGDVSFVNARNPELMKYAAEIKGKDIRYYDTLGGFHAEGKKLYNKEEEVLDINNLKLCGDHNLDNLAGVFSILAYIGADIKQAAQDMESFEPLAHRLQNVATKNGVTFINDSISTAPEAALGAMKSFDDNMVVISGGEENTQDYTEYAQYVENNPKVKMVITLYQCGPKIAAKIREIVNRKDFSLVEAESLEEAVNMAYYCLARLGGGKVLFSPTSPSFGFYKNFMERGQHFIDIVGKLDV